MTETETSAPKPSSESPETQRLIELCLAVAGGEDQLEELRMAVAQRHQELSAAMDDFFGQVERQGEEFYEQFRPQLDQIETQFGNYEVTLENILQCLEHEDYENLHHMAQGLAFASMGIRIAMVHYEETYLSTGESRFPLVNLFRNVATAIRDSGTPMEVWKSTCLRYRDYYEKALGELEKSEAKDKPGVPERKVAFSEVLSLVNRLDQIGPADVNGVAEALSGMSRAFEDLERSFDTYHHEEFSKGETDSPKVNWILKALAGVKEGRYHPQILKDLADDMNDSVRATHKELQIASRQEIDSTLLSDEIANMIEALEGMEDALLVFSAFADGEEEIDEETLEDAVQQLKESGQKMVESTAGVQEYNENLGKVTCVKCGHKQDPGGATSCVSCGAVLPVQPGSGVYTTASSFQVMEGETTENSNTVMTTVMKELFDRCEAFERLELPAEEFLAYLDESEAKIEVAEEKLTRLHAQLPGIPEEATEEEADMSQQFIDLGEDALALLAVGLDESREGLDKMRLCVLEDQPGLMKEGMRLYFEGTQKMWQVKRLEKQIDDCLPDDEPEATAPEETVTLSDSASSEL